MINTKAIATFGFILVILRWLQLLEFLINIDNDQYISIIYRGFFDENAELINESGYYFTDWVIIPLLFTLPHFLISVAIFQSRIDRNPNLVNITRYSKGYLIFSILSIIELYLSYYISFEIGFQDGSLDDLNRFSYWQGILILIIIVFLIYLIYLVVNLPSLELTKRLKQTYIIWFLLRVLTQILFISFFSLPSTEENWRVFNFVNVISNTILFSVEMIIVYFFHILLLNENNTKYFETSLYPTK